MDSTSVLHFISSQIEKIIGVIAALFIATTALLIFRSIKDEKLESEMRGHGASAGAIEDALRRVLAQNPVAARSDDHHADVAIASPEASLGDDAGKDERIAALQSALEKAQVLLKERMENPAVASGETADGASGAELMVELQKQVDDLKARLSEYEIIEDDIADLAMFKEENTRLKVEIDRIKAGAGASLVDLSASASASAEPALAAAEAPVEPEAVVVAEAEAQGESPAVATSDPFEALINEAKKGGIPEATTGAPAAPQGADTRNETPASAAPDTAEKMAQEGQALAATSLKNLVPDDESVEVLSNLVDADKLIDDVNALDAEDLMSEFKDKGKS